MLNLAVWLAAWQNIAFSENYEVLEYLQFCRYICSQQGIVKKVVQIIWTCWRNLEVKTSWYFHDYQCPMIHCNTNELFFISFMYQSRTCFIQTILPCTDEANEHLSYRCIYNTIMYKSGNKHVQMII